MAPRHMGCGCLSELASVYLREIDDALKRAESVLSGRGLSITCRPGCSSCCSLPVNATYPEAVLISVHVRERFAPEEMVALVERSSDWLAWCGDELNELAEGPDLASVYSLYGPGCPLLRDGLCTVYPVRPMGCRVHCSVSEPRLCGPQERHNPFYNPSGMVEEVVAEVKPFCMGYRHKLEEIGIGRDLLVRPLPEMLIELLCGRMPGGKC